VRVRIGSLLLRFFRSIRLALILIAYLVVTSIVASLIPQGRDSAFYAHEFSPVLARLITVLSLDNFFRSLLFLVPAALFFVNLTVCTVYRLATRIKRKARLRLGPDIIHIGLIILMLAGIVTLFGRREGSVYLAPGDSVKIPGGYELVLNSFTYEVYRDGRPKEWVSDVEFGKSVSKARKYRIKVNKPLKAGTLNIFQYSYRDLSSVVLKALSGEKNGTTYSMHPGNSIREAGATYKLMQVTTDISGLVTMVNSKRSAQGSGQGGQDSGQGSGQGGQDSGQGSGGGSAQDSGQGAADKEEPGAVFLVTDRNGESQRRIFRVGDRIDGYKITDTIPWMETGLRVVSDPGFIPILIGLLLVITGLILAFYQKIKDRE